MTITGGTDVEVKMGGSLGRWVSGVCTRVENIGFVPYFDVTVNGRNMASLPSSQVRRARRIDVPTVAVRQKRSKPKPKRVDNAGRGPLRYPAYLKWVKAIPCIFCHGPAMDPHHVGPKGLSQQTDDTKVVSVCRTAHDAVHARRPQDLCDPLSFHREDPSHAWAVVEAHLGYKQAFLITEFLREHGGVMS